MLLSESYWTSEIHTPWERAFHLVKTKQALETSATAFVKAEQTCGVIDAEMKLHLQILTSLILGC